MARRWSRNRSCCAECGTSDVKHMARGLCKVCYLSKYRADNPEPIAKAKGRWYRKFVKGTDRNKIAREQRNYAGRRGAILERDGFKCVRCGSEKSLIVHHRDRKGRDVKVPNNDDGNLETLCRVCHIAEHREELQSIRAANKFRHPKLGRWSRLWDACRRCKSTRLPHSAKGYCRSCIYHVRSLVKI